jgi:predicted ATPase
MLETIREFAAERLREREEAGQIFERHARWYLSLATSAQGELRGAAAAEWLARLDADLENLRRAIGWAHAHDERLEVELVGAAWYFLFVRGFFREGLGYLLQALETARSASLDQAELLYGALSMASAGATTRAPNSGASNFSSSVAPMETLG